MQLITCRNGHRYDPSLTSECPECAMFQNGTVSLDTSAFDFAPDFIPETVPLGAGGTDRTVPLSDAAPFDAEPVTQAVSYGGELIAKNEQLLTGWLVCVDGPEKGKDYHLHNDNNFIGRGARMDVRVAGDLTISSDKHAVITYDPMDRKFYFGLVGGASIVRLNGRPVMTAMELNQGDRLQIGQSTFVFVPLCGPLFHWEA